MVQDAALDRALGGASDRIRAGTVVHGQMDQHRIRIFGQARSLAIITAGIRSSQIAGFAGPSAGTVLGTAMAPGSVRRHGPPMKLESVQTDPAALKGRVPASLTHRRCRSTRPTTPKQPRDDQGVASGPAHA